MVEEVWTEGNIARIAEFYSPSHVEHTSSGPVHGLEGYTQYVMIYRTAFPDAHYTVEDQLAQGDKVVTRWSARVTQLGPPVGISPTVFPPSNGALSEPVSVP